MALNMLGPIVQAGMTPEIGQYYYMVDSNFRTAAQGWSRADGTGPLDLYNARNPGQVFYTPETGNPGTTYASISAAIQAAIDEMVDFRGDTLFFTPGSYSVATALVINVPDARWLGPKVAHPTLAATVLTNVGASMYAPTAAADRMELAYLQLLPVTAQTMFAFAAVQGFYGHDLFINMDGVSASTSTIPFVFATTSEFINFDRLYIWVDAAQGPAIQATNAIKGLSISNFEIYVEAGSWASAFSLLSTGVAHARVGPGYIGGGGTALTTLVTVADKTTDVEQVFIHGIRSGVVGPAAGALFTATGADASTGSLVDCWRSVAFDTAQPTFTSGANISWECGVPFTG